MRKEEIIRSNTLIADFLGWEYNKNNDTYRFPNLFPVHDSDSPESTGWTEMDIETAMFEVSWDWLMRVVAKVYQTCEENGWDTNDCNGWLGEITCELLEINREATYKSVIEWIKWYNENK